MTESVMDRIELTEKQKKARRNRSVAIGVVLFLLVVLFYWATVFKLGPDVVNKPF